MMMTKRTLVVSVLSAGTAIQIELHDLRSILPRTKAKIQSRRSKDSHRRKSRRRGGMHGATVITDERDTGSESFDEFGQRRRAGSISYQ